MSEYEEASVAEARAERLAEALRALCDAWSSAEKRDAMSRARAVLKEWDERQGCPKHGPYEGTHCTFFEADAANYEAIGVCGYVGEQP